MGQDQPEFGVVPLSGPGGMLLVVGGPPLHPSTASANGGWGGYYIYRKAVGDTGFVRISTSPLSRPGSLAALEKAMGGPLDGFERYAGLSTKQELWQAIERNDTSIIAIAFLSKNFRRALGLLMTDTNVKQGVTYEYRATLVAPNGLESKPSEAQMATFGVPMIPLLGPLNLKAESTDKGVVLTWVTNPDDSGLFSYSVYRSPDPDGSFLKLNLAALTQLADSAATSDKGSFTDTTARAGRTYYYAVVSTDYAGNESPRANLLAVEPSDQSRPSIPQNVFANPSDLGIEITWDTVSGGDIVGYNIYKSVDADSGYTKLNNLLLPLDSGWYEDQGTTLSDRYFYRVTSVNKSGLESEQSARALSLFANRRRPVPPQDVRVTPGENSISISWTASQERDVRGYYVYRADSYNGSLSQISPLIGRDTSSFTDSSAYVSSNGEYWYLLQALNYTGMTSNYSVPVAASPRQHQAVGAPLSFFGYADENRARLFWSVPNDNDLAGFILYRANAADSLVWTKLTATRIARTIGEYTDTTGEIGAVYLYRLTAANDDGVEGEPSHSMRISLFAPAPLAPGGLRISQEGKALTVVWSASLQPDLSGYRIYRRSDTEPKTLLTKNVVPIGTVEYRDSSAKAGTRYYYSVAAVDKLGREGEPSPEVSFLSE